MPSPIFEMTKAFLALMDSWCRYLSWGLIVYLIVFFILMGHSSLKELVFLCLFTFSLFYHMIREAFFVVIHYPFWIDIECHRRIHREVSFSVILAVTLWIVPSLLCYHWGVVTSIWCVTFLYEFYSSFWIRRSCESFFRKLLCANCFGQRSFSQAEPSRIHRFSENAFLTIKDYSRSKNDLRDSPDSLIRIKDSFIANDNTADAGSEILVSCQIRKRLNGSEVISGESLIEFDEQASVAYLNLSFCPPFETTPVLDFEQTSGEEADIRITLLQTYGARIEVHKTMNNSLHNKSSLEPIRIEYYVSSSTDNLNDSECKI